MGIAGEWGALTNPTCFTQAVAAQSGSAVPVTCQLGGSQRAALCQARVGTSPWTQGLGSKNNPPGDTCQRISCHGCWCQLLPMVCWPRPGWWRSLPAPCLLWPGDLWRRESGCNGFDGLVIQDQFINLSVPLVFI